MRLASNPAVVSHLGEIDPKRLTDLFRDLAVQLNGMSEGQLAAATNAQTAAPTTGTYAQGDFIRNSAPAGATPIFGWICTVAGTSGTWVPLSVSGGGGTGTVTHTTGALVNHALTGGSGATVDDIKSFGLLTDGQLMVGATGADPAPQTMSGDGTLSSLGVLTLNPLTVMTRGKVQAGFQMPMSY